jgi:hypothetical protein
MLGASGRTDLLSAGLTLLAAAALVFRIGFAPAAIVAVLLGLVARYYGFRIALDRRLFDDLAAGRMELADLDAALRSATGGRAGTKERSVADRCRGARGLLKSQALVVVAQLAATSAIALAR